MDAVWNQWRERLARGRALVSLLLLTPLVVIAALSQPYLGTSRLAEYGVDLVEGVLFACGAVLRWWATLYIGGRKNSELITLGPYSICRNPLYLGTLLMALSVGVCLQSVVLLGAMILTAMFYLAITVPVEERRLGAIYGEQYDAYLRRVPRLIPNFALYRGPRELQLNMGGIHSEAWRMLRWMWIPLACHLLEHMRSEPWWPNLHWLP